MYILTTCWVLTWQKERGAWGRREHVCSLASFPTKNLRLADWRSALMISVNLNTVTLTLAFSKGNQSWIFIGRTDAEAETPIHWPPDQKLTHLKKTLMLGKIEGRRRRGWQRMRWLDGITNSMDNGFGETPGVGEQGGLVCCGPGGRKELHVNEQLNWTEP